MESKRSASVLMDREPEVRRSHYHSDDTVALSSLSQGLAAGPLAPIVDFVRRLRSMPEGTKLKVKLGVSVLLFASLFLCGKINLSKSAEAALAANPWYLSGAIVLFLSSTILNAKRWQLLAAAVGLQKPLLPLTQYCFVGLFFNLFLPSTVGGDFSRCYYLSKGTGRYINAFYSVLADRAIGIMVLFLFAAVGILFGPGGSGLPWQLKAPILAGALATFGVVPFLPVLSRKLLGDKNFIARQLNNSVAQVYWRDGRLMGRSMALSILLQIMIVVCHVLVGLSLGLTHIPLWYYFVFYPSVAVLGFITPSFNGIGIREWAYTSFLTLMGVDRAHALTFALMWLGMITLSSLVGGLVYTLGHFKFSKEEAERLQHEVA